MTNGIRNLVEHSENPFLNGLEPSKRRKTEVLYDGNQAIINTDTGELHEDRLSIARIKWVEDDQFVKLYTTNVSIFFELSKPAQKVCEFLMYQLGKGQSINNDRIMMYFNDYEEFCKARSIKGGNSSTFNLGMRELASKALIAKSDRQHQWFINPAVVFNGDRARFITEIRKRTRKTKKDTLTGDLFQQAEQQKLGYDAEPATVEG